MKRALPCILLLLFVTFLQAGEAGYARRNGKPTCWKAKGIGYQTDLGSGKPEMVVLTLTPAQYQLFSQDEQTAKNFLNNLSTPVLKAPANKVIFVAPDGPVPFRSTASSYTLMLTHMPSSSVAATAFAN